MEIPGLTMALFGMTKQQALDKGICTQCKEAEGGRTVSFYEGTLKHCFPIEELHTDTTAQDLGVNEEPIMITQSSSMLSYNKIDSKTAFDRAEKDGNIVVLPKEDQLLIDIDNPEAYQKFNTQLGRFVELVDADAYVTYDNPSKSGKEGHRHIMVQLSASISNEKRILFQLMLGSDLRRELLSYVRESEGDPHPTLFIEKPVLSLPPVPTSESLDVLTDDDIPY